MIVSYFLRDHLTNLIIHHWNVWISLSLLIYGEISAQKDALHSVSGSSSVFSKTQFGSDHRVRQYIPGNKRPMEQNGPMTMGDLRRFRTELMYPYDLSDFTEITSSKSFHDQPLQFQMPFFGFRYTYVWIQKDGYLAFSQGQLSYKFPVRFPYPPPGKVNKGQDPSLIAPFFAHQDIPTDVINAGIYLRIIDISKELNYTLKERIYADFREGMIGASNFVPKFAIIITWKNMTYTNKSPDFDLKTNTYQAVLATDEMRTYAMFNYEQIEWISPYFEGTKGPWAYVGFNAGNSTRTYEFVPYSQNPRISLLTSRGFGNGLQGRYFFQIDEEIWSGACIEKELDPNLPNRLPLAFFPRVGNMLGGTLVNISGPCLNEDSIIECTFENWPVKGVYRDKNHASCISPPVMYHGYVDLTVRVDGKIDFYGRFYIQPPDIAHDDIAIVADSDRLEDPLEIEIKWKPEKLSWESSTQVQLSLWGYRETSKVYPSLTFIDILEESLQNDGHHTLDVTKFRSRFNTQTSDILFGFMALNLTSVGRLGNFRTSPIIWSRAMPLAWYFRKQWEKEYGDNGKWKSYLCNKWFERESFSDYFATTVFRCPCTKTQALLDRGRFSPDLQCNEIDKKCDTFHRGALHCVKTGRPSVGGSGQTCCYDDREDLLQTADTMYGGRPSRAFVYGKHPYKSQMMIPVLSEYLHDVVPFFFCCKWQEEEDNANTCQRYNYWRTSQDCSSYQSPAIASVFGDPHIITFDMFNYTFNGKGEFTLARVNNPMYKFELQGRFEQLPRPDHYSPMPNATFLRAIAVKDNVSSTVEFRVRPVAASWRYQMYVIVDKEYVYWWDESMRLQNFWGVTLYQPSGMQNMSHVIAMFDSGVGVEVKAKNGRMSVHVYAPYTFLNSTEGLLGNYSRQQWDEFPLPGTENYLPINSPPEQLYRVLSQNYRVLEKVSPNDINQHPSLFFHDSVRFSYYDDHSFLPDFDPKLPLYATDQEESMIETCSDSMACRYDFIVTLDKEFARLTKEEETEAANMAKTAQTEVKRCPALPKPLHGRKTENRYYTGTIVRFSCNDGYRLLGYEARYCRDDGLWSWGIEPECISNVKYIGQIAGISIGITLPILILLLLIVFFVMFNREHDEAEYETYEKGDVNKVVEAEELTPSEKNYGSERDEKL
ncbi:Protein mesh [Sarcoptes scabiei]|uniref:Protein mesh n=1 Tax=Sarcoptes scabiei TaxID=52283 RepID=A0A834RG62_SARSC|nr:Protein mesh [Sarcoptes scabiei]